MSADHIFTKSLVALYFQVEQQDPRDILGLSDGSVPSTVAEAKAAYRALALCLHPDKCQNAGTKELHTRLFQRVKDAYELIMSATSVDNKDPSVATGEDAKVQVPKVADLPFKERLRRRREAQVAALQAQKAAVAEYHLRREVKQARLRELYAYKNDVAAAKAELRKKKVALLQARKAASRYGANPRQHLEALDTLEHYTALREARILADTDDTYEKREKTDELRRISYQKREEFVKKHPLLPFNPPDKLRKLDFYGAKKSKAITDCTSRPTPRQGRIKKIAKQDAARDHHKQERLADRKQRSGDRLPDSNEKADITLGTSSSHVSANYDHQLTKGRITNLSLHDQERKERFATEKTRRIGQLQQYIKKYAPEQRIESNRSGCHDYHEGAHELGIDYVQEKVAIQERPFENEDVEVWEEKAKYIFGFSKGPQALAVLNPEWIHAEQKLDNIAGDHRETIEEKREDLAESSVSTFEDVVVQPAAADEQASSVLPSETTAPEIDTVAKLWSEVVKKEPEIKDDAVAETDCHATTGHNPAEISEPPEHPDDAGQAYRDIQGVEEHQSEVQNTQAVPYANESFSIGGLLKTFTAYRPLPFFLRRWMDSIAGSEDLEVD
ncbi:hypothetical protein CLAFUW4_02739 [Fulvia fulva]|uniref:J domain-containing protein n=1 Tax=Passalora fulva TaxID=5499 RepID=A0A9Q8L9E8_PASFU|nr:uncharacterized protein CLAFUR5_02726 [Fulvia fulva]KAK4631671.1 hypothetical protein CLAFUR4_02734 [Fulvia fulva]KAK4633793.1 hypothetical protein CLAFUR0_02736 [Fulvia fulva]UJO13134.1 hypothetical protein CLAFUR5_02726 [Fulvia fulva]WPV11282.1 hypothetical protein CLAFUW4_02739 [Fulvia fulva]WPV26009.1 hypothetical protein CLAFUW7_02738 [Fulvia fulva]